MTLIGVKGKYDKHLKLNPGLDHVMEEDDTCYYIGFTREEYSKVRSSVSRVHTSLWQTCANTAMLSLFLAGIDPAELDEHNEALHYRAKSPSVNEGMDKVDFHPPDGDHKPPIEKPKFFLPNSSSTTSLASQSFASHMDEVVPQDVSDRHQETRKGLQLLRFHSRVDLHANPVIKVNLVHPTTASPASGFCPLPEEDLEEDDDVFCDEKRDVVAFELKKVEEGRLSRRKIGGERLRVTLERQESATKRVPADEAEIPLRRSFSDEVIERAELVPGLRRERHHSSAHSLHSSTEPQPLALGQEMSGIALCNCTIWHDTPALVTEMLFIPCTEAIFAWAALRRASGWSARSARSDKPGEDSQVTLYLLEQSCVYPCTLSDTALTLAYSWIPRWFLSWKTLKRRRNWKSWRMGGATCWMVMWRERSPHPL